MALLRLLTGSVVVALVAGMVACSDDHPSRANDHDGGVDAGADASPDASPPDKTPPPKPKPDAGMDGGDAGALGFFDALERAQAILRQSPDHLVARAATLVAGKNPTALFEFVRDQIVTYPPSADGFTDCVVAQRWGANATLRGGAGTPREKAELLVSLYTQAGFEAEVLHGTADPKKLDGKAVLLRADPHTYAPPFGAEADSIRTALGSRAPMRTVIDKDGSKTAALGDSLLALLPKTAAASFDFTLTDIPLVGVKVGSSTKYANVIAPGAAFGDSLTIAEPVGTVSANPPPPVYVKLEASRANEPNDRVLLVENTFDAADVVGRRINLGFAPPVDVSQLAFTIPRNVNTFVPILNVSGAGMTQKDRDRLGTAGKAVNTGGDIFELDAKGKITVNGAPLPDADTDPKAAQQVVTVAASAEGAAFPEVDLRVSAADKGGASVQHLGADSISVTEDGTPVSFTISQNEAPPPRVVLMFDASTSVPADFRGAGAVQVGDAIVNSLYAKYPNAQVRVGTIDFGAAWADGGWATTKAGALAEVGSLATAAGGSEIWTALRDSANEAPTLIVLVTDGDATDDSLPEYRNAIAAGPPVLSIGVGTPVQATLDDVSALSGGKSLPATAQMDAVEAVLASVDERATEDYEIHYDAPADGKPMRDVQVTINGKKASTSYTVPDAPAVAPVLSGLYLTVRTGGKEVTRALAGYNKVSTTAAVPVTPTMIDDVKALLHGRLSIGVEGAAPMPSILLDDWISDKLSLRPLFEAYTAKDNDAMLAALKQGFDLTPSNLSLAQPPLPGAISKDGLTFETGLRLATYMQKAYPNKGPLSDEIDLYPLSSWATASDDPRAAFVATLRATAALAINEDGLLGKTSTLKALAGKKLIALQSGTARDQAGLTADERLAWIGLEDPFRDQYTLLTTGKPGAFWVVENATGTLIGMLPDGSGGSTDDACSTYNDANTYLQGASLVASLFGVSVGGWIALAQWEVKEVTIADIVIGGGDLPPGVDPGNLGDPTGDMICGSIDDALGNAFPPLGVYENVVSTLDNIGLDTPLPTVCGGSSAGGGGDLCN